MPIVIIFHKRNAFTLYGVGNYRSWLIWCLFGALQGSDDLLVVMTIDLNCVPAEGFPLINEWAKREYFLAASSSLPTTLSDCNESSLTSTPTF